MTFSCEPGILNKPSQLSAFLLSRYSIQSNTTDGGKAFSPELSERSDLPKQPEYWYPFDSSSRDRLLFLD